MLWLDFLIFGNGRGMKSPHWDDVFFWLDGRLYSWVGGLGAQLRSREWRKPDAGTRRRIAGREFVVFSASRRWLRVEVAWAMVGKLDDIDAANAAIRALRSDLNKL